MSKVLFSVNDPIHGLMQFRGSDAEIVKSIINTSEFQRLRHIKQLGMDYYVYPGANHNRFSHCLGAAYLGKRVIEKLIADRDEGANKELLKSVKELVMLAGLLHDVGHGPYSHMFERAKYGSLKFEHEEMTVLIIERLAGLTHLSQYSSILKKAKKLIESNGEDLDAENQIAKALISSQLDVDRMDYLLRDSHFCGVDYGNYDKKWLIHGMQHCQKDGRHIIGINRKAIGVVEHYLMARRLMTNCVYKHPKVVASEYLLGHFIEEVYNNLELIADSTEYKFLPMIKYLSAVKEKGSFEKTLDEYIAMSDMDMEVLIKLLSIQGNHENESFKMIADIVYRREFPVILEIDSARYDEVEILIKDFFASHTDIKYWQVHLDSRKINTYKTSNEKIYVIDNQENIKTIDSLSLPLLSMANKSEVNPILIIDRNINSNASVMALKKDLDSKGCLAVPGEFNRS